MTIWRWRTGGVPSSLAASGLDTGMSAFMPAVTKSAASQYAYMDHVDGQPGTQAIPAPNNDIPQDRYVAGRKSSDAPPQWYPSVYYQGTPFVNAQIYPGGGNDSGVCIYSDNQLPVPAVDPTRGTYRMGGGQVVQPFQETSQPPKPAQHKLRKVMRRNG
jgi:hypothetical protein